MNAACARCGGPKEAASVPCPACGWEPSGDDRAVAWLFSREYLSPEELEDAASRIREGHRPDPSRALIVRAKAAVAGRRELPTTGDPLGTLALVLLGTANLLFTPLCGFAVWFGYRRERPAAARQALRITLPVGAALAALWAAAVFLRWTPLR